MLKTRTKKCTNRPETYRRIVALNEKIIAVLRWDGVIQDLKGHLISGPVAVVKCSDGQQSLDILLKHADAQKKNPVKRKLSPCEYANVHVFAGHGGALRIPRNSPINKRGRTTDIDLMDQIKEAYGMGYKKIVLYTHAPCKKATSQGLNIVDIIDLLIQAKYRLKSKIKGISVACFLHVDYQQDNSKRKRTYFISKELYLLWRKNNRTKLEHFLKSPL